MIDVTTQWGYIGTKAENSLQTVLKSWEKTPYGEGQRARRIGVDCRHLIIAVLDTLYKVTSPTKIPAIGVDAALHNPTRAWEAIRIMREMHYGSDELRANVTIEPGDIIITRAEADPNAPFNPAHAMIAAVTPWTALHAAPVVGTVFTSVARTRGIVVVYRPRRKDLWRS